MIQLIYHKKKGMIKIKRYFIYADEQTYGGLHGIYTQFVIEVDDDITEEEIWKDYIKPESINLMESFGIIEENVPEENFEDEDEYEDAIENFLFENVSGFCFLIKKEITISTKELDAECCRLDKDSFIEKYCI